jgi:DNA-binding MurR/RpiR family transcriptional regulator
MMEDILPQIASRYKTLTPRQRKVAEYLFHNLNQAILLNSRQLAAKAGVSEATLIRFITSLGFAGFPEFKKTVGQKILEDSSTSKRLAESARTLKGRMSMVKSILNGDVENIQAMNAHMAEEVFENAVKRICGARRLYVLGLRSSYSLAFYLAFNLRFFLTSVTLIELGIGDIPEQLRDMGSADVLVAISFKRYTREVVRITEKTKIKGTYVLAVTNSELSPIAQLADGILIAQTGIPSYFESFVAPMSLLNALITAVAVKKKEKAVSALERLESEFERFETFTQ